MTLLGTAQILIFFAIVVAITKPLGIFMYRVFEGKRTFLHPIVRPVEHLIYWLGGVREDEEQSWIRYSASMISLSIFSFLFVYLLQRLQGYLPLNPMHFSTPQAPQNATALTPDLAFNTAVSFMTNTNWQSYSPDTTVSYLTQMAALAVQNFVSAAVGIAVAVALIRGFARHSAKTIGNFWVDVTRCILYVLLPISILATLFFVWQGSIQNFKPAETVPDPRRRVANHRARASGIPARNQDARNQWRWILQRELRPSLRKRDTIIEPRPNATDLFLGAGLTYTFGKMVRDTRQGWAIFTTMAVMFLAALSSATGRNKRGIPLTKMGIESAYTARQPGGNMEGKEVRFGNAMTALFATVTTDASCGAVIGMHDNFTPIGGLVPLFNIQTDEVIFGGVGAGLYSMLIYVIVAVFIGGLMVGRTPEYVGKKIEQKEVKMAIIAILATSLCHSGIHCPQFGDSFRQRSLLEWLVAAIGNFNNGEHTAFPKSCTRTRAAPATMAAHSRGSAQIRPGTT